MPRRSTPRRTVSQSAHNPKLQPKAGRPFAPGYGLAKDEKGLLLWTWVAEKMSDCRTFWVATVHPSNRPHVMPVWGVWVDDAFYFSTGRKSRKGRNLAANPACTVTNDDGEEAVIVEGSAEEVKDAAGWPPPTCRSTRLIRGAWASRFSWCGRGQCSGLSRRAFRSRRRGGGWEISW